MKVLHVIPSISGEAGGPSQAILPLCRALRNQGIDLLLATTDDGSPGENGTAPLEYARISDHGDQPTIFFRSQIGSSFKYSRPFTQWLNSNVANYDLVHIHAVFNHASMAAALACRRNKVPYIVRPLGTLDPWGMKQKALRKKIFWHSRAKSLIRGAAAIHYTSDRERQAVESSLGLNHGRVIPLGVDVPAPDGKVNVGDVVPGLEGRPYVLVLSRLLPTKGLDPLLDAFLRLSKDDRFEKWRLVLAGSGPHDYVSELKRLVVTHNACSRVLFPGWLNGEAKGVVLRHAGLLALPSHHENFGLCVMEALACSVPVLISPQVNLSSEVEAAGAGWIVAIDSNAIESALKEALAFEDERIKRGRAGKELARQYSWPSVASQLIQHYQAVIREHSAA